MRTYYRGPDVVVTSYALMTRTAPGPFPIRELRQVHITRPAGLSRRFRLQHHQLRATYRGQLLTLYSTSNERVFNQVARALRRSIEDAQSPIPWHDLQPVRQSILH